jgi:hypothetical protein
MNKLITRALVASAAVASFLPVASHDVASAAAGDVEIALLCTNAATGEGTNLSGVLRLSPRAAKNTTSVTVSLASPGDTYPVTVNVRKNGVQILNRAVTTRLAGTVSAAVTTSGTAATYNVVVRHRDFAKGGKKALECTGTAVTTGGR